MKNILHLSAFAVISFINLLPVQAQTLSSSPTISFTNNTGFADNIAQDGEGGSVAITDFNLQVFPINGSGALISGDPLEFHSGSDWPGYPALITYGDINQHYGWAIKSDNGNNFSLQSVSFLDWGEFSGATFVIQAFSNNVALGTVNFTGNTTENMVVLSSPGLLNSNFHNVDEVRIYQLGGAFAWTGLNHIRVSSPAAVLPVQGLVFNAALQQNGIYLDWQTNAEQGTKNFVVQRSSNGSSWTDLCTLNAANSSTSVRKYHFMDHPETSGMLHYRLQMADLDGSITYSRVIKIDYSATGDPLKVYTNPVMNGELQFGLKENGMVELYNASGKLVLYKNLPSGVHMISLPLLSKGVYYLKAGSGKKRIIFQ